MAPECASALGSSEVELRSLAFDYAHLRARDLAAEARLSASLERQGQLHPLSVVARDVRAAVLVDGYRRVRALRRLGVDTARVLVIGTSEPEALAYVHRLSCAGRRTALEDGWLVRELCQLGWTLEDVGTSLGRSRSWVSRRLGLAEALPTSITDLVRRGVIPAHGAMRCLLPLARANKADATRIAEALASRRVSSRALDALWTAYKRGDAEQRSRIAESPALFLRAHESTSPEPSEADVMAALRRASLALSHVHAGLLASQSRDEGTAKSPQVRRAVERVSQACAAVGALCSKEVKTC